MEPLHAARPHLQGSADFHHVVLLDHSHSEVVGLHELLQESAVGFILAAWESIKSALDCDSNLWAITQQHFCSEAHIRREHRLGSGCSCLLSGKAKNGIRGA